MTERAVAVVDDELRRRDAEAALGDLYQRVLEVERLLHEARSQAADAAEALEARNAANADLQAQLMRARSELAEERRCRYEAQANYRNLLNTKTFRLASIPRRLYSLIRTPQ